MSLTYIDSYYSRTLASSETYPPAEGQISVDICIIGAGLAGLTAGVELARSGRSVAIVEAERVAWGASGRNGGFVTPGYATSLSAIESKVGQQQSEDLYRLSIEGMEIVRRNIGQLKIVEAQPSPGIIRVVRYDGGKGLEAFRELQDKKFGRQLRFLPKDETQAVLQSPKYHAALLDEDGFHFHPLNYGRALAREIVRLGGKVFESSPIVSCDFSGTRRRVGTRAASIDAEHVLFTTGGYTGDIFPARCEEHSSRSAPTCSSPKRHRSLSGVPFGRRQASAMTAAQAITTDWWRMVRAAVGRRITTRTNLPPATSPSSFSGKW